MTGNTIVRHVLLALERAGWDSLCNQTGSEYYGELMLPDALMVLANGMVMDRDMVVSALSESPPWRTYDIGDVRLIEVDNTTPSWSTPAPHTARPTRQPSLVRCRVPITAPTVVGSSRCISRRRSSTELLDAT
jgi:hypothetical protein